MTEFKINSLVTIRVQGTFFPPEAIAFEGSIDRVLYLVSGTDNELYTAHKYKVEVDGNEVLKDATFEYVLKYLKTVQSVANTLQTIAKMTAEDGAEYMARRSEGELEPLDYGDVFDVPGPEALRVGVS